MLRPRTQTTRQVFPHVSVSNTNRQTDPLVNRNSCGAKKKKKKKSYLTLGHIVAATSADYEAGVPHVALGTVTRES